MGEEEIGAKPEGEKVVVLVECGVQILVILFDPTYHFIYILSFYFFYTFVISYFFGFNLCAQFSLLFICIFYISLYPTGSVYFLFFFLFLDKRCCVEREYYFDFVL